MWDNLGMATTETKTQGLRVNVTPSMESALLAHAASRDVPLAQVIREALRDYLKGQVTT